MPVFEEDPTRLSKSRLKSDLVAHNVTLPTENSKKDVYVDLHLKHIDPKNAADFSSDEEDQVIEDTREEEASAVDMLDVSGLTDDQLKATLLKHGVRAGPIVASTRALYERRLQKLLQSSTPTETTANGTGDAGAYSDSEEEEEDGQGKDQSDSDDSREEAISHLEQTVEEEQRVSAPASWEPRSVRNVENAIKSPLEASQACGTHAPSGLSGTSSVDGPTGLDPVKEKDEGSLSSGPRADGRRWRGSKGQGEWSHLATLDVAKVKPYSPKDESVFYTPNASSYKQTIKERSAECSTRCYPETASIPDRITATCRRPIKGAAGRPVQYKYPDAPPASPLTLERREVESRLVPVYIQLLVFLAVACVLYLVYACMEENQYNPLLPLLDGLSEIMDSQEEGPAGQADPVDLAAQDSLSA